VLEYRRKYGKEWLQVRTHIETMPAAVKTK